MKKSSVLKLLVCVLALGGAAVMVYFNMEAITGPKAGPSETTDEAGADGEGDGDRRAIGSGFTPKHAF